MTAYATEKELWKAGCGEHAPATSGTCGIGQAGFGGQLGPLTFESGQLSRGREQVRILVILHLSLLSYSLCILISAS